MIIFTVSNAINYTFGILGVRLLNLHKALILHLVLNYLLISDSVRIYSYLDIPNHFMHLDEVVVGKVFDLKMH